MKNPRFNALLAAALLGMTAFAASAQTAPTDGDTARSTSPAIAADDAAWEQSDRCLRQTGTRIGSVERKPSKNIKREERCLTSVSGRSHSGEDLRRTGQRNVADALQMLDPAVR